MSKRLIVTGGNGFVAGSVIAHALGTWDVYALTRKPMDTPPDGLTLCTLDYSDAPAVEKVFHEIRPDAVIHAAAIAAIDYCEAEREAAHQANVQLTEILARHTSDAGAKFVFVSTDNVFRGDKGLYTEEDAPAPVNYYGRTKVEAEHVIETVVDNHVTARVSLIYGLPVLGAGNSFLSKMIATLEAGGELGVPDNEIRSPVDVVTVGRALVELAGNTTQGVIHLAGTEVLQRTEMARRIAVRLGYARERVVVSDPTGIPGRADRPRDVSLSCRHAQATLSTPMLSLDEGMDAILN